mmetsp:Transcript_17342/g.31827  ORF Transcript_17342/g.31827 Transcript_17342/m.31827 type:complete len:403 (+) Transcript_17342:110-1318(+)
MAASSTRDAQMNLLIELCLESGRPVGRECTQKQIETCEALCEITRGSYFAIPRRAKLDLSELVKLVTDDWMKQFWTSPHSLVVALETLILSGNLLLKDPFQSLPKPLENLCTLDLTGCIRLQNESLASLCECFPSLQVLRIGCCYGILDNSVTSIAQHLDKLREISLEGCTQVTDVGLGALVQMRGAQLQVLNISGLIQITEASILAVQSDTQAWVSLRDFRCTGCLRLGQVGLEFLVHRAKALSVLHVAGIRHVNDKLFVGTSSWLSLKYLNIEGCWNLTGATLAALQQSHQLTSVRAGACPNISRSAVQKLQRAVPGVVVNHQLRKGILDGGLTHTIQTRSLVLGLVKVALPLVAAYVVLTPYLGVMSNDAWSVFISGCAALLVGYLALALLGVLFGMGL